MLIALMTPYVFTLLLVVGIAMGIYGYQSGNKVFEHGGKGLLGVLIAVGIIDAIIPMVA